jgi:hypothetical protein
MNREDWLEQFIDELKKLRPHLGDRFARTLALQAYSDEHPRVAAREYDRRQRATEAPTLPAKKRSAR